MVVLLISAFLHLAECLDITGDRGDVESPIFLFDAASALYLEENHSASFFYGLKKITTPL